ncbi:MAG: peptide deformylase [Cyanobacteriota bacterium]
MSVLEIKKYGNNVLRQPCKKVQKFSAKIKKLIEDLLETMYAANGVGLAAPQVGVPLKVFVIDVSTGDEPLNPIVFVNPVIIKKEGAILSYEGCLSFPEVYTNVKRHENVIIKAFDHKNRPFTMNVTGGTLLCRAIQHEFDHLQGILFVDHTINRFETNNALNEKGLPPIQEEYLLEEIELEEAINKKIAENQSIEGLKEPQENVVTES